MRILLTPFALISLSLLCPFSFPPTPVPQMEGPSASGSFEIFLERGATLNIEFHAESNSAGEISGETIFRDNVAMTTKTPVDNSGPGSSKPFYMRAQFDCLVIQGNKAIMSGSVTESSLEQYIGRRVLVAAQENGGAKGSASRDKITWGVYRNQKDDPFVLDAERPEETISPAWIASDAERPEDEGVLSNKEKTVGCQSFPLSALSFINASQVKGSVHIKP